MKRFASIAIFIAAAFFPAATPAATPASAPVPVSAPAAQQPACPQAPPVAADWFALGDPALPEGSSAAGVQGINLGFDEAGRPLLAIVVPRVGLAVVTVNGSTLAVEPLGVADPVDFAVGADSKGVLIAAVQSNAKTVILRRSGAGWQRQEHSLFCQGNNWDSEFGAMKQWPLITIDGSGNIWQGCIDRSYAPTKVVMMPSSPPLRSVRLRLGRLNGSRWVDTGLQLPLEFAAQGLLLTKNGSGDPVAFLTGSGGSGEVVVPRGSGAAQRAPLSLKRVPTSGGVIAAAGAGWFRYDSGCETAKSCILEGPERLELPVLPNALARRGELWVAALVSPLRLLSGDGKSWRPYIGSVAGGVSAAASQASGPALALDRCGQPVVMWQDRATQVTGRRFDGHAWQSLGTVSSAGPHGLVIGQDAEVLFGAWRLGDKAALELRRIGNGAPGAAALPVLQLPGSEWRTIDVERTRLSFDTALHAAVPIHDNALAPPYRIGFRLDGAAWRSEAVRASLVDAPAMPWGAQPEIAKQSALAIDESGRQIVVWADGTELAAAHWDGAAWQSLSRIPAGGVFGIPAIAAAHGRICVAWAGPSGPWTEIFLRCRRGIAP